MEEQNLTNALRPGPDCPPIERLGQYADGALTPEQRRREQAHIAACANCQAELALLHEFAAPAVRDDEAEAVRWGVEQLRRREPEIFDGGRPAGPSGRRSLSFGRVRPALAVAIVLLAFVGGYYVTNQAPRLPTDIGSSPEATRSLTIEARSPIGDQAAVPTRLEWQAIAGAARYRVRLSEVDRREIWSGDTIDSAIDLPSDVRARIVPGKTLVWRVTAYGASNAPIAESNDERFRLRASVTRLGRPARFARAVGLGARAAGGRTLAVGRCSRAVGDKTMVAMLAAVTAFALGATALARSGSGSGSGSGSDLKFRVEDEMAPPGGMVQMKVEPYEVTPISGGRPGFSFDSAFFDGVEGFDMFVTGELAGAAVVNGSRVNVSYATRGALSEDYPFLTVSLRIRPDAAIGARARFTLDPLSIWNLLTGPVVASRITPGTVTVGGSVSITDVVPGGGVWPAGTVVSVRGIGFTSRTRLRVNDVETRSIRFVSPTEMRFTLARDRRAARRAPEGGEFRLQERVLLVHARHHRRGQHAAVAGGHGADFFAHAAYSRDAWTLPVVEWEPVRRPGASEPDTGRCGGRDGVVRCRRRAAVSVGAHAGQPASACPGAVRASRGVPPPPGSSVVVTSSAPIEAIGLLCDEGTWTVSASLPLEALH